MQVEKREDEDSYYVKGTVFGKSKLRDYKEYEACNPGENIIVFLDRKNKIIRVFPERMYYLSMEYQQIFNLQEQKRAETFNEKNWEIPANQSENYQNVPSAHLYNDAYEASNMNETTASKPGAGWN